MKKVLFILVGNLMVFCLAISFANHSFSLKLDNYINSLEKEEKKEIETDLKKLSNLNLSSDGSELENKVDIKIKDKNYIKNEISIIDSDFKISEELLEEIKNTINEFGNNSSFYIVSLNDGMSIGYNIDKNYESASSIKAPYTYYVYRLIDEGMVDENTLIEYLPEHYNPGTGVIKESEFGTKFSVEEIVHYTIKVSDNIGHLMLHDTFGVDGYNKMLKNLGIKNLNLTKSNPWSYTSCRSAAIIWQDIYNFSLSSTTGLKYFNELLNTNFSYFEEAGITSNVANKAGWANRSVVETGIVFDENPYIGCVMAVNDGSFYAEVHVTKMLELMDKVMKEYGEYKKMM